MKKEILLTIMMIVLSILSLGAISASAETYGNLNYTVSDGKVQITGGSIYSNELIIPSEIDGYPVTSIGRRAFYNYSNLERIIISEGISVIGQQAFYGCTNLKDITIPDSITTSHDGAFDQTAYYNDENNWEDGVLYIGQILIETKKNLSGEYTIKNGTRIIEEAAFLNCNQLTSIIIPNSVTKIENMVFQECRNLINVTIPSGVLEIGDQAFYKCSALESIVIPDSVCKIGSYAFSNCSNLSSIVLPDNFTFYQSTFHSTAYYNDDNNWENGVLYIGYHLIEAKTYIDGEYVIKPKTTTILSEAFYGCTKLESVVIPDSVCKIGSYAFYNCSSLRSIAIPEKTTKIQNCTFYNCSALESVTIPSSMLYIEQEAFSGCSNLSDIYYNGNITEWKKIHIEKLNNGSFSTSKLKFFYYVTLFDVAGNEVNKKKYDANELVDISDVEERLEHTIHLYTDEACENEYFLTTPICENLTLYLHYVINQYPTKFINYDGDIVWEGFNAYGTVITPPENPMRERTQQYTYEFAGWEGFNEGITQSNTEMSFTAVYNATLNQYTYEFLDEDGTVLKNLTANYGERIEPANNPADKDPYTFDYWQGYTENMTVTENVTFKAVYKYKNYLVNAEGLSEPMIVTYNSNFVIEPQKIDDYHYFIGYFTEENGKGIQITNEKGESLSVYNIVGDLKVYPHFYEGYMNKVELQGVETAMPGDTITQSAIFATDKDAMYLVATVKFPKHLSFKSIKGVDFKEATKDSEKVVGDYKYVDITCVFDYEGNFAKINTNYVPFEIEFDVNTDATLGACEISIENVTLIGYDTFDITDIKNHTLTILPKLAESIEIIGKDEIDATEQFSAVVSPDYTTDKSVVWAVNDETVATITEDGTVTPVKNGIAIITATAKDGSEVFATKTVNVIAYSKINSLDFGGGVVLTEFNPDIRKYTVYVNENANSISLTPTFSGGGVLRPNGSGVWVSGRPKDFDLNDTATTITLNRENVTDMTNSVYTIEVIKFEGTKTKISEDKKSFTIKPINIENGKTVILALYNGEQFVEMQSAVYSGEAVPFTTTKTYTKAKVMVWDDLTKLNPVCNVEEIN